MKTTVYYDGACHLCSREMKHYKKKDKEKKLLFVDITGKDFDAKKKGLIQKESTKECTFEMKKET